MDQSTQIDLSRLLEARQIKPEYITDFLNYVHLYNDSVENFDLIPEGFQSFENDNYDVYDAYELSGRWLNSQEDFLGSNCRITSYSLLRDYIDLEVNPKADNNITIFDNLALDTATDQIFSESDRMKFNTFYAGISAPLTQNTQELQDLIREYWQDHEIKMDLPDNLSLISIYIHSSMSPEDTSLFIGHTGILIETDDQIYFLEKLAFDQPYQLLKVKDRQNLYHYFMTKYDDSDSQESHSPLILENDQRFWQY